MSVVAYARVLTANELGARKLHLAHNTRRWPIEVGFKASNLALATLLTASISFPPNEEEDVVVQLHRSAAANALWTAFVHVPQGELMYTINSSPCGHHRAPDANAKNSKVITNTNTNTIAVGSLFVTPPDAPAEISPNNIRHTALIHSRPPSNSNSNDDNDNVDYYRVVSHTRECAAVHFVFHPVPIECGAIFVEFRGQSIRLKYDTNNNNSISNSNAYISPILLVPYDTPFNFSFRVNLRNDPVHPTNAPLTHLGWDPSKCHSGALVTWDTVIELQNPHRPFPLIPVLLLAAVAVSIRKAFRQRLKGKSQASDVD